MLSVLLPPEPLVLLSVSQLLSDAAVQPSFAVIVTLTLPPSGTPVCDAGLMLTLLAGSCSMMTLTVSVPQVKVTVPVREAVVEGLAASVAVTVVVPLLPLVLFSVIHDASVVAVQLLLAVTLIVRVLPLPVTSAEIA